MDKNYILLFIIIIICLVIPTVQARIGVWDNFEPERKVHIRNILNNPVVTLELVENTEFCLIDCHALIKITPKFDLDLSIPNYYKFDFVNRKGLDAQGKGLTSWKETWYYLETETYQVDIAEWGECESGWWDLNDTQNPINQTYTYSCVIGTHQEERTREVKHIISKNDFLSRGRTYYILLEGKLKIGSSVDWQPTFYGHKLGKYWAWWDATWGYKQCFNITENSGFDLVNYTFNRTFNNASLASAGKINADMSDFRVILNDSELAPYNFTYHNASDVMVWWRYPDNFTASGINQTCFYYGKSGASDALLHSYQP